MVSKWLPKAFKYCLTKFVVKAQLHFQEMELIKKLMNEHDLHFPSNNLIKKKTLSWDFKGIFLISIQLKSNIYFP